jgi:hypothetical protein
MTADNLMSRPSGPLAGSEAKSALLAQNWWAIALLGVFATYSTSSPC